MSGNMTVKLDSEMCVGCGACAGICEEIFEMEGRIAFVKKQPMNDDELNCAKEAMEACCVEAITID
ncbi:MAG: ferredoxin [Candidatus Absconditabacteria bacterium]